METLITKNFKVYSTKQFLNLVDTTANAYLPTDRQTYIYAVLGKQLPWDTIDSVEVPPVPTTSIADYIKCYKQSIYARQLTLNNVSLVVPRINWTYGTVYNTYNSDTNFYVLTSNSQVFKCLDNNGGASVNDEPTITLSSTSLEEPYLKTGDGYKWKYMYTIPNAIKQKFMDLDWMPVIINKFVKANAVAGSIDIVDIINSGNNYINGSTRDIFTVTGDGSGAVIKAVVENNKIVDTIVQDRGSNYTNATITINDDTGFGANVIAQISPIDGHGYDPIYELGASTVMINIDFDGNENGFFPTDNDFRQMLLLANPYKYGTETYATDSSYTTYTKIHTSAGLGDFSADEKIFQGASLDTATFTADVISFDTVENNIYVNNIVGNLVLNQQISGNNSKSTRVAVTVTNPTLQPYSGKIIYIANKLPVSRHDQQVDRIRFIVSF